MIRAVEEVRDRTNRAAAALEAAGVPYAVIGGNAVAAWVSRVDIGAVRNTKDVDILLRRADLPAADAAMSAVGFVRTDVMDVPIYLDGPDGLPSRGVHVILAGEKVKPADPVPAPDVSESERGDNFQVLGLDALLRMKLTANRRKDLVHVADLIGVGLVDATWPARFPPPLDARLQAVLDDPDG
jgi:hypothetical protein